MMVAVVASIGTVLLFQGMESINSFNSYMLQFLGLRSDAGRQDLIIEHIQFNGTAFAAGGTDEVEIWVRNVGISDATVTRVMLTKLDSQHLIINADNFVVNVPIKQMKKITITTVKT